MAAVAEKRKKDGEDHGVDFGIRKKLKLSELPLSGNKRADIEALVQKMKKKGHFDILRKQGYAKFEGGDFKATLLSSLETVVDSETTRDPSLLAKDRRIAAPLIEGTAERNNVYRVAEDSVNQFVQELLVEAEKHLRHIRKADVGEEAAQAEQEKGSKTNEDWDREADERRQSRLDAVEAEKEEQRKKDREKRRKIEEEKRKRREEDEARDKERQEREDRRRAEREAERERERERERKRREEYEKEQEEYEREREERRERRRREDREREREREERYERERRDERERRKRRADEEAKKLPPEREKELEEAALKELLKEGQALAKKSQRAEVEIDEALAPPPRKTLVPKSIKPQDPAAARLAKLSTKSPVKTDSPSVKMEDAADAASATAQPSIEAHVSVTAEDTKAVPGTAAPREASTKPPQDKLSSPVPRVTDRTDDRGDQSPYVKLSRDKMLDASRRISARHDDERGSVHGSHRERSRSRESRHRDSRDTRRRSRSPPRRIDDDRDRRSHREREEADRRKRSRSRDPPDIDRYVPSSGRRPDDDKDKRRDDRDRDRAREERPRERDDRPRERDRNERPRERDRERERADRPRERDREREDQSRAKDDGRSSYTTRDARDERHRYTDIDRYIPGGGARKDDDRDRDHDRSRTDRDGGRDRNRGGRRERSRSRGDRDRDRRRRSRSR